MIKLPVVHQKEKKKPARDALASRPPCPHSHFCSPRSHPCRWPCSRRLCDGGES
jgi:hypothetical protein